MEPYARAYLQFLTCAAGSGPNAEAFVFATRLTRLTARCARAARARHPARRSGRARLVEWDPDRRRAEGLQRPSRPAWMARGALVVILSDGWERGDPALAAREMNGCRVWPTESCG